MKIELEGYGTDDILKTLYQKKVNLKNVYFKANYICFEILDKDYKIVKRYIKNFKIEKTQNKIKRFPKFLLLNLGVILGVFFGSLIALFLSNYTWQIYIYGNDMLSKNDVLEVLKNNGVSTKKINLNSSEDIEIILLNNYNMIAQVSVIKKGTAIIINISEKLVYENTVYQPITAKFSGIVKDINFVTGTLNVKVGDFVNVGDPIVLPFILDNYGNTIGVSPLAEISGDIMITNTEELPKYEKTYVRTGNYINCYQYKLFSANLFKGKNKNSFALFDCVVYNESISDLVPFYRINSCYYELKSSEIVHDFIKEKDSLIYKSSKNAHSKLCGEYTILNEKSTTCIIDDVMYATHIITAYGRIND